jgi:hypothetical protein
MNKALATRPIFIKLTVLGVVAVGMILSSLFWLTERINEIESAATRDLAELMVAETVDHVQASTNDYAFWSLAYEIIEAGDAAAIYEHMGSGAVESELFDQLVILSNDHNVLHVFDGTDQIDAPSQFDVAGLQPFLSELAMHEPSALVSIAGIGEVNGVHGAITTAWITPDYVDTTIASTLPILVGIVQFSEDELQAIERMTHGSSYAIRPSSEPVDPPSLALPAPMARRSLNWFGRRTTLVRCYAPTFYRSFCLCAPGSSRSAYRQRGIFTSRQRCWNAPTMWRRQTSSPACSTGRASMVFWPIRRSLGHRGRARCCALSRSQRLQSAQRRARS